MIKETELQTPAVNKHKDQEWALNAAKAYLLDATRDFRTYSDKDWAQIFMQYAETLALVRIADALQELRVLLPKQ